MLSLLPSLLISSCVATRTHQDAFDAPPERVREAVLSALAGYDDVRDEQGVITTGWGPETDGAPQGLFIGNDYRVRVRHRVELRDSVVSVSSVLERRAPGGLRANRWERADGGGKPEAALLDAIASRLEKKKP
jgi:hypothetical protein